MTNAQYVEFLNAVANETAAYGLYDPSAAGIDFPPVPIDFERFFAPEPGASLLGMTSLTGLAGLATRRRK